MIVLNSKIVNDLAVSASYKSFKNAYDYVSSCINEVMDNIMNRNPYISDYTLLICNEAFTGCEIAASSIDIFLALNAIQLELNYTTNNKNKFVDKLKAFWSNFRKNFRLYNSRKVSKKKVDKAEKKIIETTNYSVKDLYNDIQIQLIKMCSKSTTIKLYNNKISIVDKSELGVDINIYPVFINENKYNMYDWTNGKSITIDFRDRYKNVNHMYNCTKQMSRIQTRILNSLFYNVFKQVPNQIFTESLIFNVPMELFQNDIYETTVNIINFIKNGNLIKFKSICNENTLLFDEPLNVVTIENAYRFIQNISFE